MHDEPSCRQELTPSRSGQIAAEYCCGLRSADIGLADCAQEILIHSVDKPDPGQNRSWARTASQTPSLETIRLGVWAAETRVVTDNAE
jgi:hypothetical protein